METLGEYLIRVRKTCGYSLEDAAMVTRVNIRYLEAMENDDIGKLPGDTFFQGFVRSYAKFLGITEEEINKKINETRKTELPPVNTHNLEEKTMMQVVITSGKLKVILPLGLGVVVLMLLLALFRGGRDSDTLQYSKNDREAATGSGEVQQAQIARAVAEPIVLKMYAKELTWIRAKIDDREIKDVILKPGEGVMWNGEKKIVLTIGNAGGIEAEINDKTYGTFGKRGEVARDIVITSDGVSK